MSKAKAKPKTYKAYAVFIDEEMIGVSLRPFSLQRMRLYGCRVTQKPVTVTRQKEVRRG